MAGLSGHHVGDERAVRVVEADGGGDLGGHRLDLHAEPAALDLAAVPELGDHGLDGVRRDGEAHAHRAAVRRVDGRVHPDHLALEVEQRAAGVAAVDRGVGLDEVDVRAGGDVAGHGRDDAAGDGAAEAEGVADGDHVLADAHRVAVAEHQLGQAGGVDLEQREVGLRVGADDLGVELAVVGEADLHLFGVVDHVVVGDDVAVVLQDEARAQRHAVLAALRPLLRHRHALGHAEAAEEFLEGRTLAEGRPLGPGLRPSRRRRPGWPGPSPRPGWPGRPGRQRRSEPRVSAPASGVQAIQAPAVAASAVVLNKVAMRVISSKTSRLLVITPSLERRHPTSRANLTRRSRADYKSFTLAPGADVPVGGEAGERRRAST